MSPLAPRSLKNAVVHPLIQRPGLDPTAFTNFLNYLSSLKSLRKLSTVSNGISGGVRVRLLRVFNDTMLSAHCQNVVVVLL